MIFLKGAEIHFLLNWAAYTFLFFKAHKIIWKRGENLKFFYKKIQKQNNGFFGVKSFTALLVTSEPKKPIMNYDFLLSNFENLFAGSQAQHVVTNVVSTYL